MNYDVDQPPYYEMLPDQFPSDQQMFEFMYNYEKELHANADEEYLQKTARAMVEVGISERGIILQICLLRKRFPLFPFHTCFGEFGAFFRWKFRQLILDLR